MKFEEVHEQIRAEIQTHLCAVASGARMNELGKTFEELSTAFQGLAVCHLLEFAETRQFRENLARSGHCRRYFLRKSREQENLDDNHLALSRSEAFLDAVACNQLSLARDIARLSFTTWNADWEYEDDFCYYLFLHSVVVESAEPDEVAAASLLRRFEGVLEGQTSLRLEVCKALLSGHEQAFVEHFGDLIYDIRDSNEKKRPSLESHEFLQWPRSFVSVEGLALLRIAESRGIRAADEWPLCPPLTRLAFFDGEVLDIFKEIERSAPESIP